uniref:WRKY domain-containing protein n=1 Tax=Aegilops tauschii subsp. strangulata TaxID=200361 RepID=A0A453T561_AEGTS
SHVPLPLYIFMPARLLPATTTSLASKLPGLLLRLLPFLSYSEFKKDMDEQWMMGQTSLSLGLNVGRPTARRGAPPVTKVLVEEDFMSSKKNHEVEALEAELRRVGEENRMLSDMLRALVAKYSDLQGKVSGMMAAAAAANNQQSLSTSEGGSAASPSRKRARSDSLDTAGRNPSPPLAAAGSGVFAVSVNVGPDQAECTSVHEPCDSKRVRADDVKASRVSKLYVHADPSDLSLVSGEGWVPMAEVRTEGDQGQSVPEGLLPVLVRAVVPGEEEGAAQRRRQDRACGHVRRRSQPRTAAQATRLWWQEEGRRSRPPRITGAGACSGAAEARGFDGGSGGR